jgi:hypothetical protein
MVLSVAAASPYTGWALVIVGVIVAIVGALLWAFWFIGIPAHPAARRVRKRLALTLLGLGLLAVICGVVLLQL